MSTISKDIADRIITGEFEEDNIYCILRYENAFNGDFAYKILSMDGILTTEEAIYYAFHTAARIHTGAPVMIYWVKEYLRPPFEAYFPSELFVSSTH